MHCRLKFFEFRNKFILLDILQTDIKIHLLELIIDLLLVRNFISKRPVAVYVTIAQN